MTVQPLRPAEERLRILGDDEIEALYGQPRFTYEDRTEYFALLPTEKVALGKLHSIKSQVCFVLQLGYFKARRLFFMFTLVEVKDDIAYVLEHIFPGQKITDLRIAKGTRLNQQRLIRDLFDYRLCDVQARKALEDRARQAAKISGKPIYVFRELLHSLQQQRIVAPGYRFLQDVVSRVLTDEQHRLIALIREHLTEHDIDALQCLLADSPGLYEITQLKHEPRDFSLGEIKQERQRGEHIEALYNRTAPLLSALEISNESIKYYASLVDYYSVYKLKRFNPWTAYLYLICFIHHRYQRRNDNLLNTLRHLVRRFGDEAKTVAKDRVYASYSETRQDLKKAGRVLRLFADDDIAPVTPFCEVQASAFAILERDKLTAVADQIATNAGVDETGFYREHIDTIAHQIKRHLRPVVLAVEFGASPASAPLVEAVEFLQATFRRGRSLSQVAPEQIPIRVIPSGMKRYLSAQTATDSIGLLVDRYEFFVYRQLRNALEAGDVFCRDSVRFRSFEDDLLDEQDWQEKDKLITDAGLTILRQPISAHLSELEELLEARLVEVNRRIDSGDNPYLQVKHGAKKSWTLRYPQGAEPINHPVFEALKQVDVASVLHFVNQRCQFIEKFDHLLGRYAKQRLDDRVLVASLVAWGTNLGLGRMGQISDITSARCCIRAAMGKNSRPVARRSTRDIHPNTSA